MAPDTKQKIIYKAIEYFSCNDYERASLNDIAGALNITKGGIYHYFESKDHLFHECMVFIFKEISRLFIEMFDADADIEAVVRSLANPRALAEISAGSMGLDFISNSENLLYLMFTAIKKFPTLQEELSGVYIRMAEWCEGLLKEGQKKGTVRHDLDCRTLSMQLIALSEGSLLLIGIIPEFERRADTEAMVGNILKWIKA